MRLVYAPPLGVGNYGGGSTTGAGPATGDFALLRAYATDGAPVPPRHFFPLSKDGVREEGATRWPCSASRPHLPRVGRGRDGRARGALVPRSATHWASGSRSLKRPAPSRLRSRSRSPTTCAASRTPQERKARSRAGPQPHRRAAARRGAGRTWARKRADSTGCARRLEGAARAERGRLTDLGARLPARHDRPRAARPAAADEPGAAGHEGSQKPDAGASQATWSATCGSCAGRSRATRSATRHPPTTACSSWVRRAALPAGQRIAAVDAAFGRRPMQRYRRLSTRCTPARRSRPGRPRDVRQTPEASARSATRWLDLGLATPTPSAAS